MNASDQATIAAAPPACQLIAELTAGWHAGLPEDCATVAAADVPAPFHDLLVHRRHMTIVLRQRYASPLHLIVHRAARDPRSYRRCITLSTAPGGPVVELGLVRLNLAMIPAAAQEEILHQSAPLGDVLNRHRILRRILPTHYLRVPPASSLLRFFDYASPRPLYGRTGIILCNGQPAIDVLEIVTGIDPAP